jgi:hypothetical protein
VRLKILRRVEEATLATNSAARGVDFARDRVRDLHLARSTSHKRLTRAAQQMQHAERTSIHATSKICKSAAVAPERVRTWQ